MSGLWQMLVFDGLFGAGFAVVLLTAPDGPRVGRRRR